MAFLYDFGIFCGDQRQVYLEHFLRSHPYQVCSYALASSPPDSFHDLTEFCHCAPCIIGPAPLCRTKDRIFCTSTQDPGLTLDLLYEALLPGQTFIAGNIPPDLSSSLCAKQVRVIDLLKIPSFVDFNSTATAEGAICEAIRHSTYQLFGSHCAVLGYGHCGEAITRLLLSLSCKTYIADCDPERIDLAMQVADHAGSLQEILSYAPRFDFLFYTIPHKILPADPLISCPAHITLLNISSPPGGIDPSVTNDLHLNVIACPSLPGRFSPASCAQAIYRLLTTL